MGAAGALKMEQFRAAGFSDDEILRWRNRRARRLRSAGFSNREVSDHFGVPDPNLGSYDEAARRYASSRPQEEIDSIGFVRSLELGFQQSVSGLLMRGGLPESALSEDAPRADRIASQIGTLAGDLPAMVAGFAIGGGPTGFGAVTGTAAAFALPAGIRQVLMDRYADGEAQDFEEFWDRFTAAFMAAGKGYATGAAVGAVSAFGAARAIPAAITTAGEIGAMVGIGSALEGHVPGADEFIDAAILIGGFKAVPGTVRTIRAGGTNLKPAVKETAAKLRNIYARTGKRPAEVIEEAVRDPSIKEDVLSTNHEIPRAVKPLAEREVDPVLERAAEVVAEKQAATRTVIQRELKVSAAEADRILGRLEEFEIVGPKPEAHLAKTRDVLVDSAESAVTRIRERGGVKAERAEAEVKAEAKAAEKPDVAEVEKSIQEMNETRDALGKAREEVARIKATAAKKLVENGEIGNEAVAKGTGLKVKTKKEALAAAEKEVTDLGIRLGEEELAVGSAQRAPGEAAKPPAAETQSGSQTFEPVLGESRIVDVAATEATLPPVAPGFVRLFRAESPTVGFGDVFKAEALERFAPKGKKGKFFSEDMREADYFRETFGRDAEMSFLDLPQKVAESLRTEAGDFIVPERLIAKPPGGRPPGEPPKAEAPAPPPEPPKTPLEESVAAVNARIVTEKVGGLQALRDRFEGWSLDRWYTDWVDKLHPINVALREMVGGGDLPAINNAYKLARVAVGVTGKAVQFLESGTRDFVTGQINGKGLREILIPIGKRIEEFRSYVVAVRAIELSERGKPIETGIDITAARAVRDGLRADFEVARADLIDFQTRVFKYLTDSGIIDKRQAEIILEANKDYVPFFRLLEEAASGGGRSAKQARNPIFRISGSGRMIHDPLESIIKNTYMFVELAERNNVVKRFVDVAEVTGRIDIAKRVEVKRIKIKLDKREREKLLKLMREGQERELTKVEEATINEVMAESFSIFRPKTAKARDDQVVVFRDGKREVWNVDPEVAKALNSMSHEAANVLVQFLGAPARLLRAGAVFSPEFIARNPIRDTVIAFLQSEGKFNFLVDTTWGAFAVVGKTNLYREWAAGGGMMAELVALDRRYLQTDLKTLSEQSALMSAARNVVTNPIEMLRIASQVMEQATRVAEFGRVARGGKTAGRFELSRKLIAETRGELRARRRGENYESPTLTKAERLEAAFASREVSLDFGRIGARAQALNQISAFFNAQVQGADKMVRVLKDHPQRTLVRGLIGITLPSVLLRMANEGEEGFTEIADWQKDLFWVIPTQGEDGKNTWWRIPKPFQFGLAFGTLAERAVEAVLRDDPKAFEGFLGSFMEGAMPSFIPTAAVPMIEAFGNENMFTDRSIIPIDRERLLPEAQYTPYTSELTKAVGSLIQSIPGLGRSRAAAPAIIDNTVRAWTGGLGIHAMNILDSSLQAAGVLPDPVDPADTLADIPVVKAFAIRHPSASAQSLATFYERYSENQEVLLTIKAFQREGRFEAARELRRLHGDHLVDLTQMRTALSRMSRTLRMIDRHPSISPEEKRNMIDRIYIGMISVARSGNQIFDRFDERSRR